MKFTGTVFIAVIVFPDVTKEDRPPPDKEIIWKSCMSRRMILLPRLLLFRPLTSQLPCEIYTFWLQNEMSNFEDAILKRIFSFHSIIRLPIYLQNYNLCWTGYFIHRTRD